VYRHKIVCDVTTTRLLLGLISLAVADCKHADDAIAACTYMYTCTPRGDCSTGVFTTEHEARAAGECLAAQRRGLCAIACVT